MSTSGESGNSFQRIVGRRRAYAVGVAILATALASAYAFHRDGLARSRDGFRRRAAAVAVAVQANLTGPIESVRSIPPYFAASGLVEADEFRVFVAPTLAMHDSVTLVGFAPGVVEGERAEVETQARASGFADFAVRERYADGTLGPSRSRANYLPILYCEPRCAGIVGVDLAAGTDDDARAAARALAERKVTIASRTKLAGVDRVDGVLAVFAPLTERAVESTDLRVPRPGVGIVVIDVEKAIAPALAQVSPSSMRLDLRDDDDRADAASLFTSTTSIEADSGDAAMRYVHRFRLHDRTISLRFTPAAGTISAGPLPVIVAASGALLAIVTTIAILLGLNARRLRAEMRASRQLGPYRLIRRIGQGGMGTVYEAEHALLRRPTAVKVISDDRSSREALERFEREAKITSQLTHPNTIVVFDFGRTPDDIFYYAMEFLRGFTLDDVVKTSGAQPAARVVHLLRQIAGSLAEAHSVGLVHRDVKPANVMICTRGGIHDFVKVLDFGLVKDLHGERMVSLSIAGQTLGTPRYMAPETFVDGERPTPAADVYAVGAIAYYLLTGHELIEGSSFSAILAHHTGGIVEIPSARLGPNASIPEALDRLVVRCLSRDKADRPADGEALRRELDACGVEAWTEDDARQAKIGHDERFVSSSGDFSGDDTLAVDVQSRERGGRGDHDGTRAA